MKAITLLLTTFFANWCLAQYANGPVLIDQGTVNDNVTITFTASGKTLTKGQTFSLRDMGLQYANYQPERPEGLYYLRPNCQLLNAYRDIRMKSYDIEISSPNVNKKYYGKIAFFAADPAASGQAVTRDYLISVPQEYFDRASNGQTADVYEYYHTEGYDYVTWVIWLSDVPFPSFNRTEILQQVNVREIPKAPNYKKPLGSGIAQTVIASIFLPVGAALTAIGSINGSQGTVLQQPVYNSSTGLWSDYSAGTLTGGDISMIAIGSCLLVTGTVMIITGPIKISRALKLKRQGNQKLQPTKEPMELCFSPMYNPGKAGSYGCGFNLKF